MAVAGRLFRALAPLFAVLALVAASGVAAACTLGPWEPPPGATAPASAGIR
ncbi:hypothetical protein [Microbacterium luticocti]|uniref:hypothetical protein n=1 Tax=Microbacterium luticocti TaxID=451764 RepID=UPI00040A5827|nr:hypothetical protein [Microbacterium luticocti]